MSGDDALADVEILPENIKHFDPDAPDNIPLKINKHVQMNRLELAEYEVIRMAYERCDRNASKTAKALGISINTVYSRMRTAGGEEE